ncbi:hypothetical protein LAD12857_18220 [Lacrimispora amygdalina]|uniref:Uncharacterized protein n=1 Tax=Lacrimispora amygdalina TaxID=253257 RepID=A0ABQ5M5N0_9FIRM
MLITMMVSYLIVGFIYASVVVLGVTLIFCIVVLRPKKKTGKANGQMHQRKKRDACNQEEWRKI